MNEENDELANKIIAFFKECFGMDIDIGPAFDSDAPYAIETHTGNTFTFEIAGETRIDVALRYFNHVRSAHRFVVENKRSGAWIDGGRKYKPEEKERSRTLLAKFDAWANENLPNDTSK